HTRLQGDWSSDVCSSDLAGDARVGTAKRPRLDDPRRTELPQLPGRVRRRRRALPYAGRDRGRIVGRDGTADPPRPGGGRPLLGRSEERRVGKEGRTRWVP